MISSSCTTVGAASFKKDHPDVEALMFDPGYFALKTYVKEYVCFEVPQISQ